MDQYEVLKNTHKVGHPISGIVTGHKIYNHAPGFISCDIQMQTESVFKSILPYHNLFDNYDFTTFDESLIPASGVSIEMVIMNYVDGTLYLSASPNDITPTRIAGFVEFYEIVESLNEGTVITGKVAKVVPFGVFVKLPQGICGLIDIGYPTAEECEKLPYDNSAWPQAGDIITCKILGFRFHEKQIALNWLSDSSYASSKNGL
ncbi:S1 RNA-binding domain-containing protein [Hymenobacter negativus]|uniref:S1 RNA-binding domain-containing protein n=1 Tax=Hymenobacter negativus TaxID=2795026 RepID=A0ABS3QJN3_9BACT|nr:S1 RNA-binding domain-containing protein [Hymenobacter negativus]MBO2011461.1 S1 RNA-binding domain-containing protein [Hymenobacter negativus]